MYWLKERRVNETDLGGSASHIVVTGTSGRYLNALGETKTWFTFHPDEQASSNRLRRYVS